MEAEPIKPPATPAVQNNPPPASNSVGGQGSSATQPAAQPAAAPPSATPEPVDTVTLSSQSRQALEAANRASETASDAQPDGGATGNPQAGGESANSQRELDFTENNRVVLKIVDPDTREVIRSIPSEQQVQLSQAIQDSIDDLVGNDGTSS